MEYKDVADAVGMTIESFYDWIQSFEEDYIVAIHTDDEGVVHKSIVYTDGDDGVMIVSKSREGRDGLSIKLVGSTYVEFTPKTMLEIVTELL